MTVAQRTEPRGDTASPQRAWDVATWVLGPRRPYRVNTFYRCDSGAVVTATGSFASAAAVSALGGAVRWFDLLPVTVVVDVCHAVLGDVAARALVELAARHGSSGDTLQLVIAHAGPETARRVVRAGGGLLLR